MDLMNPRYKVIDIYPGSPFLVGTILVFTHKEKDPWTNERHWYTDYMPTEDGTEYMWSEALCIEFKNIFRRLEWWEERDEKLLPKYLKNTAEHMNHYGVSFGQILKVERYDLVSNYVYVHEVSGKPYYIQYTIPATESEYEAYMASLTNKTT